MAKYIILSEIKGERMHRIKRFGQIKSAHEYGMFIQELSYDRVAGTEWQKTMTLKPKELENLIEGLKND